MHLQPRAADAHAAADGSEEHLVVRLGAAASGSEHLRGAGGIQRLYAVYDYDQHPRHGSWCSVWRLSVVFDAELDDACGLLVHETSEDGERHVDAGGYACRGHEAAVCHHALAHW